MNLRFFCHPLHFVLVLPHVLACIKTLFHNLLVLHLTLPCTSLELELLEMMAGGREEKKPCEL